MCFFDKGSFDIYIFVTYFHAWDDWKKISNHSHTNQKLVLFLKRIISKQQGRRSLLFWEFRFWISNPPLQILTMLFFIIFMKGHFDRLSVCIKKIIVASLNSQGASPIILYYNQKRSFQAPNKSPEGTCSSEVKMILYSTRSFRLHCCRFLRDSCSELEKIFFDCNIRWLD